MQQTASARAHANIALIKYFGKRDVSLNLPAMDSLSVTLDALFSETRVCFSNALDEDDISFNEKQDVRAASRIKTFLDRIRFKANIADKAKVTTKNNFPTGAGLASSASGFAALALAASHAAGLQLSSQELCEVARLGSGSAPRSLFGGFVKMNKGIKEDGSDAVAMPMYDAAYWPITVLVALTTYAAKHMGSTDAMEHTKHTSPYYNRWVTSSDTDMKAALEAIQAKDFDRLGDIVEHNALKMHAAAIAAKPGIVYWNAATLDIVHAVQAMRKNGIPVFFTIDAGAQVKVFCMPSNAAALKSMLQSINGVKDVIETGLGPGAHMIEV